MGTIHREKAIETGAVQVQRNTRQLELSPRAGHRTRTYILTTTNNDNNTCPNDKWNFLVSRLFNLHGWMDGRRAKLWQKTLQWVVGTEGAWSSFTVGRFSVGSNWVICPVISRFILIVNKYYRQSAQFVIRCYSSRSSVSFYLSGRPQFSSISSCRSSCPSDYMSEVRAKWNWICAIKWRLWFLLRDILLVLFS